MFQFNKLFLWRTRYIISNVLRKLLLFTNTFLFAPIFLYMWRFWMDPNVYLKLNCRLLLLQSRAKSQLLEFATHRRRARIKLEDDWERQHSCFMAAILNFKYQVIWGLESKTLHDLGSPIEDLIILALHGPPRINKGIWSGFQQFSFRDLASDDCILTFTIDKIVFRSSCNLIPAFSLNGRAPKGLGTTKWTNYIGQREGILAAA